MNTRRTVEVIGQTVVGDGITCLIVPRKHMLLWVDALPWRPWRTTVQWFADHKGVTAIVGLIECVIGVAMIVWASRDQEP
jgi:hypothetical protein